MILLTLSKMQYRASLRNHEKSEECVTNLVFQFRPSFGCVLCGFRLKTLVLTVDSSKTLEIFHGLFREILKM